MTFVLIKRFRRAGLAAIALLTAGFTSACGGLVPGASAPAPDLFTLSPKSTFDTDLPVIIDQIVVDEPLAARGLDTDRIALRPSRMQVDYFASSRWTDRAPKMVQTLLVESFENTERVKSVGRQAIGLRSDFSLKSELREFQAEYFHGDGAPLIRVRLNMKLVRLPAARIIASETFEAEYQAETKGMTAIVTGFDEALGKVMRRLVEWSVRSIAAAGDE